MCALGYCLSYSPSAVWSNWASHLFSTVGFALTKLPSVDVLSYQISVVLRRGLLYSSGWFLNCPYSSDCLKLAILNTVASKLLGSQMCAIVPGNTFVWL